MSDTWKCPKCGAILRKGGSSLLSKSAGMIIGTATCSNCGAQFTQNDVYHGKYDVEDKARQEQLPLFEGIVSAIVYQLSSSTAPDNTRAITEELLKQRYPKAKLGHFHFVGWGDELTPGDGLVFYNDYVSKGKLTDLGTQFDSFQGKDITGKKVVVLFFSNMSEAELELSKEKASGKEATFLLDGAGAPLSVVSDSFPADQKSYENAKKIGSKNGSIENHLTTLDNPSQGQKSESVPKHGLAALPDIPARVKKLIHLFSLLLIPAIILIVILISTAATGHMDAATLFGEVIGLILFAGYITLLYFISGGFDWHLEKLSFGNSLVFYLLTGLLYGLIMYGIWYLIRFFIAKATKIPFSNLKGKLLSRKTVESGEEPLPSKKVSAPGSEYLARATPVSPQLVQAISLGAEEQPQNTHQAPSPISPVVPSPASKDSRKPIHRAVIGYMLGGVVLLATLGLGFWLGMNYGLTTNKPARVQRPAVTSVPLAAANNPATGEWIATTDFGKLEFTVDATGTKITKMSYQFSNWTCGPGTVSGTIEVSAEWLITYDKFHIYESLDPNGYQTMNINGIYNANDRKFSGTWSEISHGINCSGSWETTSP